METKQVMRSRTTRMLGGVAGGLGTAYRIDPLLIRIGFVALSLVNGLGLIAYLLMWMLMPVEGTTTYDTRGQVRENLVDMQATAEKYVTRVRGLFR